MNAKILRMALIASGLLAFPLAATAQTKIYIDPGHGGSDPGAVNSTFGTQEAARVLYTGQQFRDYLNADTANTSGGGSWSVRMSRNSNVSVSLSARSVDSNNWGSARFLSIHQNAFNQSANGTETFSFSSTGTGASLRNVVQSEAIQAWGLVNRGNKTANFAVLRNTSAPAILTEMGFIDAPADHPFCSSNVECQKYALHMLYAVQQHYGLAEFNPSSAPPPPPGIIVDNGGSGHSESGSWGTSTSSGFYGSSSRWANVTSTASTSTFTPNLSQSGQYEVYVWYVAGTNRSSGAKLQINHLDGAANLTINQEQNGSQWVLAGTYNFNSGTSGNAQWQSSGSLNDGSTGTVISADAVRFLRVGDIIPQDIVVDNSDSAVTLSSNWFPSTSVAGYLGSNYHARATQSISDSAKYNVTLPTSGTYKVEARWTTGSNRATATPYVITHNGGNTTVAVNQQQNNGTWVNLGNYSFNAGTAQRVQVSCWTSSGSFVIADGIRFTKQ